MTQPDSNGNRLTNEMVSAIAELKSGDKFSFEDIKAVGPDGKTKMLNSIILQIQ